MLNRSTLHLYEFSSLRSKVDTIVIRSVALDEDRMLKPNYPNRTAIPPSKQKSNNVMFSLIKLLKELENEETDDEEKRSKATADK